MKGALTRQANLLLGADVLDLRRPAAAATRSPPRRARRGLATTPALKFNSMVQRAQRRVPAAARCSPTSRRSAPGYPLRGAIAARRSGQRRTARRPTAFPRAAKPGPTRGSRQRLGVKRRRFASPSARRRSRSARSCSRSPRSRAASSRSGRGCSSTSTTSRRPTCCSRAIAPTYRLLVADAPSARRARSAYLAWLQQRAEARPADGERARPAARGAADARARGAVPRPRGAGRGDPRRGRGRARRVALPAPPSRHRGDAALLRRVAAAQRSRCSSLQFVVLGVVASAAGVVLALAGQQLLVALLASHRRRPSCRRRRWLPGVAAFGTGMLLLFGFALPPLIALAERAAAARAAPRPAAAAAGRRRSPTCSARR